MLEKKLSSALQALIDNRLDAIDQNLLRAGVPRHQRQSVGEEVENQILEMLTRLEVDEWTRQDVLGVLARLDPPEAYVPEDSLSCPVAEPVLASSATKGVAAAARASVQASVAAASQAMQVMRSQWQPAWLACFAAALGGFTLFLSLAYLTTIGPGHDSAVLGLFLLMVAAGASTLMGALSLYYLRGGKEYRFALAAAVFATLLYPLLVLNGLLLALGAVTYPASVGLLALLLFGGINAALGRLCWRWATRKPQKPAEMGTAAAPLIISG